jgi:Fe-S cluster assembly protein SufD
MSAVPRPPVPGSLSNAAYEQRLRDAIMDSASLLNAKILPVSIRSAALNKALAAGLPQLRDDLWRYADLKFLASAALAPIAAAADEALAGSVNALLPPRLPGYIRLVIVNGRPFAPLSDDCAELAPAATPLVPDRTRHERFGWLNDAFATGVARLAIHGSQRLEVIFAAVAGTDRQAVHPRLEIVLGPQADLVLLERHLGSIGAEGLINAAVQVQAGPGSRVRHLRWQQLADDAQFLDTTQIALDRDAQYCLTMLQLGARTARTSFRASMHGAGAELRLQGAGLSTGRHSLDHSWLVDHLAPHTVSTQVFRAIAREHARIACRSRVEVGKQAGGARVEQSLKGLLGGAHAEIDLRPQLEIYTDEVRATHGATTGALDDNMRFYLLSRGIDPDTARGLLEWAFLEDAVRGIELPELRSAAELTLANALGSSVARQVVQ